MYTWRVLDVLLSFGARAQVFFENNRRPDNRWGAEELNWSKFWINQSYNNRWLTHEAYASSMVAEASVGLRMLVANLRFLVSVD